MRELEPRDWIVAALALCAAVALIASYFASVVYVTASSASCVDLAGAGHAADCNKTGGDQHSIAYILLALAVLALAGLFVARREPLAGWGLAGVGLIALLIAVIGDLPDTNRAGALGADYTAARAHKGAGFWLELGGGLAAMAAGAAGLIRFRR